ncbi:hypothetical protein FJ420_02900 [Mesorhizobium sp. B3-1-3]|uniref:hypothetical protein n=1 Tax=unclassified Mesorhizobium TaxID=325217 RepID=UPI001126E412|nr:MULTISPECIES: hypothetical protein [unclassified Mesorhizobium]TPI70026.1 hypothetical protein FJ424_03745 [Mesorhizobium sp. B3-1-8]TPI75161.1 hypothetical protein FJ420_02900 [Mesorhizobium sp. B3-1-3]
MHPLAKNAVGNLNIVVDLALDFFLIYSRFEYAAKDNGHVQKPAAPTELRLSHNSLAMVIDADLQAHILTNPSLRGAVEYYENDPPRKQIWDGTKPDWKVTVQQEPMRSERLLIWLTRVRNNLFHGGKGFEPESKKIGRDMALLENGLVIIEAILACDEDMRSSFSSYQ